MPLALVALWLPEAEDSRLRRAVTRYPRSHSLACASAKINEQLIRRAALAGAHPNGIVPRAGTQQGSHQASNCTERTLHALQTPKASRRLQAPVENVGSPARSRCATGAAARPFQCSAETPYWRPWT